MKHRIRYWILMVLVVSLLAGCALPGGNSQALAQALERAMAQSPAETAPAETEPPATAAPERVLPGKRTFSQMEYVRPDLDALEDSRLAAIAAAENGDAEAAMDALDAYFDGYDWYYTYYAMADICYNRDLRDSYWEKEYNFFLDSYARVDEGQEEAYYALAAAPCCEELETEYFGEGFFDDYQGENPWDEEYTALLEEESALISRYYTLSGEASDDLDDYADGMAQVLVDLIRVRQEIAAYWGFDSYPAFANDMYYYRDYTLDQMEEYLQDIARELVPLYRAMQRTHVWDGYWSRCAEADMLCYLQTAAENMGGTPEKAFREMVDRELCDLTRSENKFNISFEVYLTGYEVPYVFLNPMGYAHDKLTLAHEFGHFCNDYASRGSYAGVDVLEVFSQSMEYLSLCYGPASPSLERVKLADSLSVYVEQSMYASFEMKMYALSGEDLSVEGLYRLYQQTGEEYGFDSVGFDGREFVDIPHFYTHPMYVFSYVVSNDAAMQIYMMELENSGAGLTCFEENIDTEECYFLAFLESAGLSSPFDGGSLTRVREMLETHIFS